MGNSRGGVVATSSFLMFNQAVSLSVKFEFEDVVIWKGN